MAVACRLDGIPRETQQFNKILDFGQAQCGSERIVEHLLLVPVFLARVGGHQTLNVGFVIRSQ